MRVQAPYMQPVQFFLTPMYVCHTHSQLASSNLKLVGLPRQDDLCEVGSRAIHSFSLQSSYLTKFTSL